MDEDGQTPMMLAASQNMHRKLDMMFHAYMGEPLVQFEHSGSGYN